MTSREDATAADVFSRLGAGPQDPVPGGSIREYSGKVKIKCEKNPFSPDFKLFWYFFTGQTK